MRKQFLCSGVNAPHCISLGLFQSMCHASDCFGGMRETNGNEEAMYSPRYIFKSHLFGTRDPL